MAEQFAARKLPGLYLVFHHRGGAMHSLAAALVADCLESVFHATNHGASSEWPEWDENPLVMVLDDNPRSTSTGDLVLAPDGAMFKCMPIGWDLLYEGKTTSLAFLQETSAHSPKMLCHQDGPAY